MSMRKEAKLELMLSRQYWHKTTNIQRDKLIGSWFLWQPSGRFVQDLSGKTTPSIELLDNGGFEKAGAGGADIWLNTTEVAGDGAIADEAVDVHAGGSAHAAKITGGASANTYIRPGSFSGGDVGVAVWPGLACVYSFWTHGDGINAGRYSVWDASHGAWIRTTVSTGVAGAVYTQVTYSFTVPAGCYNISLAFLPPAVNGGIAYFDDVSFLCSKYPNHGLFSTAGITYGVPGIGDGKVAARFSGVDTHVRIGYKGFAQWWNGNLGSAIAWGRVDAAEWTDAASYRYLFHPKSRQADEVYIVFGKNTTNHQLVWRRRVMAATYEKTYTWAPTGPTTWFCMGFTWDILLQPKRFAGYLYAPGVLHFTKVFDEAPGAGVGDQPWDPGIYSVDNESCVLAAGSTQAQEWIGDEYMAACWSGVALSELEMKRAMVL